MTDVKLPCRNTVNKWLLLFTIVIHYHRSRISEDERAEFLTETKGRNARISKTYIICFLLHGVSSRKKKSVLDATEPKNRTES